MSDIVKRLRRWTHAVDAVPASDLMDEAADEIARLRDALDEQTGRAEWNYECVTACEEKVIQRDAEIARLREAIRCIADQDATLSICDGNVTVEMDAVLTDAESLARLFHDEYERRSLDFGYETRPDTRRFDPESPNGRLMIAVCRAVLWRISPQPTLTDAEREAVGWAFSLAAAFPEFENTATCAATLRGLLERLK